ncbi:MAG: murein hydrolase activator EnvC family protein [Thermomicrobiales bacterium]
MPANASRSRRAFARAGLGGIGALALSTLTGRLTQTQARRQAIATQSVPIRWPGRLAGDGFLILHGYAAENVAFAGWWHTGENWYAIDGGDTAGAEVLAVAPGVVVFAGYDYPGPVVIVQHTPDRYSMYGHLDYALSVSEGDAVEAGQAIGTVLRRTDDGGSPSHLHFEIRDFLFRDEVNGDNPSYGVHCGYQCAPGPGYWPQDAPEHPSQLGWLNPLEEMTTWREGGPAFEVTVSESGVGRSVDLLASPEATAAVRSTVTLAEGRTFSVTDVASAPPVGTGTSAVAYAVWYRTTVDGLEGWFSAIAVSNEAVRSDGRPSAVELLVIPLA